MAIERIPIKFHLEGNKIIFNEMWNILTGDSIVIEQFVDLDGKLNITNVYLERRVISPNEPFGLKTLE